MQHIAVDKLVALNYFKYIDVNDYVRDIHPFKLREINAAMHGEKVFVRGLSNKVANKYYGKFAPGDWHLFFDEKNGAYYKARILLTFNSPTLSDQLWNNSFYENIIVFEAMYETYIPYSQFNPTIGYKDDWFCEHGFMVADETKRNIPEALKLIEAAPETAVTDFPILKASSASAPVQYADDIKPDPMFITGFNVDDKLNLGSLASDLQNKVEDIFFYHINSKFNAAAYLANPDRKKTTFNITIENAPDTSADRKRIQQLIDELEKLIEEADLNHDEIGEMLGRIVGWLREGQRVSEEFRRIIKKLPEFGEIGRKIKNKIHEIEYQLLLLDALGIFNSSTGIHLYYDRIDASTKANGYNLIDNMSYIAAHEMEHAWHYADVKSKTGKWYLHDIPEYHWVKESIAEYFALCYCQYAGNNDGDTAIHCRSEYAFPYDGGYSGALLLEANPKNFDKLYKESLDDMELAFKNL